MPPVELLPNRQAFGDFAIERDDERLVGPAGPVKIGHKAYQVLVQLVEHEGKLLTKDALFSSVWDGTMVSESSLTSVIKELRRALGDDPREPRYIESVYGRGYRLIPPVVGEVGTRDPAPAAAPRPPGPGGKPPLVLVSPFNDEAVHDAHPYCGSHLREEVLAGLSRVREIQLVADDGNRPLPTSGRGYQLSATLLPTADGVKVVARARRIGDGLVVWGESMILRGAGGTAVGVDKIVRRIVAAALPAVDDDVLAGMPPQPGDLYDAYLVAKRRSLTATNYEEAASARDALERIIGEQPDFGLAYPPLVRLYNTDFGWTALGATGASERAKALRLAKQGLAADQGNAHAHSALGWCYLWHEERELAQRSFERALSLNPYLRVRVQEAATAWTYLGDFQRAQELLDRALELDPVPDSDICEDVARLKLACGQYDEARELMEQVVPGTLWADLYRGAIETALGGSDETVISAWLNRVTRCWHGSKPPSRGDILAWIRKHHPLPADKAEAFFTPVAQAIGA